MLELGKYMPLKSMCAYFLDQYQKQGLYDMDTVWLLGTRAIVDMGFDFAFEPETTRLVVNGNKTVPFPNRCLSWTKIGLLTESGEISTLKINKALTTWRDTNPTRLPFTADINDSIGSLTNSPVFVNYYYDGSYYNLFGVGGGLIQYGECRVDEKNQLVVLNPDFRYNTIMFESINAPDKSEGDYKVETCLLEAVIAFIEWKLKLNTEQNYYARVISARRRMNGKKVTLQSINQVIRESDAMKLRS